jgi:predicted tellurium resistance membrane protein TerC
MKRIVTTFLLLIATTLTLSAQSNVDDFFRSTGKIYTVLGVVVILFLVLIIYLIRLEKKISKIEKQLNDE